MTEVTSDQQAFIDRCAKIVVQQLGVEPETITPEAKIVDDLGADSLDIVELVMAFEEEFGVEITDEEAEKVETIAQLWALMARLAAPPEHHQV